MLVLRQDMPWKLEKIGTSAPFFFFFSPRANTRFPFFPTKYYEILKRNTCFYFTYFLIVKRKCLELMTPVSCRTDEHHSFCFLQYTSIIVMYIRRNILKRSPKYFNFFHFETVFFSLYIFLIINEILKFQKWVRGMMLNCPKMVSKRAMFITVMMKKTAVSDVFEKKNCRQKKIL